MAVHIVAGRRVITDFWAKPIPDRRFDWQAIEDGTEESGPVGNGRTEAEALADLAQHFDEIDDG